MKRNIVFVGILMLVVGIAAGAIYWQFSPKQTVRELPTSTKKLNEYEPNESFYYPIPARPTQLYGINTSSMQENEIVTIMTLQGILAKQMPRIYIYDGNFYNKWANLIENKGIPITNVSNPWDLVHQFKSNLTGYILYSQGADHYDESYCVAVSMAGILNACVVEVQNETKIQSLGLTKVFDARNLSVSWIFNETNWNQFRHDLSFEVEHHSSRRFNLVDYAVFAGAPVWHARNLTDRASYLNKFEGDFIDFGWGAVDGGEDELNDQVTRAGGAYIPSDWCRDLSTISAINTTVSQKTLNPIQFEQNVHYVTIVMSDGDNIQWMMNDFSHEKWFGNAHRGQFAMGWQMQPAMAILCPIILKYYYNSATTNDRFIAGVAGHGVSYLSHNPFNLIHTERSNAILEKADVKIVTLQDFGWDTILFNSSTKIPSVKGIIYTDYGDYNAYSGNIQWINEKPCVSFTYNFWKGYPEDSAHGIANSINSASRNVNDSAAYSIINVHAWSYTLDDVAELVDLFADDVRIIDPETYFQLLSINVPHTDKIHVQVNTGLQWILWSGSIAELSLGMILMILIKRNQKK